MKTVLNAVLFQTVWFICVLMGSVWGLIATALFLIVHDRFFMISRREWRLLIGFLVLGVVIDGTLFQLGVFALPMGDRIDWWLPPIWLLCLWVSVGTLFVHSLIFLRSRYVLSAMLGAIGPTMSYFAGAKLAGIELAQPISISLTTVAIIWAMVIPFGVWLSEKWELFPAAGETR